jgi:hypothetical protein
MRTELMAAIYDKALKRTDYSGIIDKDKIKDDADKKAGISPSENPSGDEPKAGADVGKIVNLMAVDANRIAMMVSGMYFIYGGKSDYVRDIRLSHNNPNSGPLEIIIASVFLYKYVFFAILQGTGLSCA